MDFSRNEPEGKKDSKEEILYEEKSFRSALPQILATLVKNLILLGYGMTLGFPTIVIPALSETAANATLHLTKEEISWFGSINLITVPLGCVVSGLITQPFGRKRSMQGLTIPFFITWMMFHYAESVPTLYASLALTGLAGGLLEAAVLTYVAEITQPHLRGFLSASSSVAVIVGMFTQFLMGTFVEWRTLALINSSAPIVAFIALCFIPESPHWLIGKDRFEDAEKALCWLRGWRSPQSVQSELTDLKAAIRPDIQLNLESSKATTKAERESETMEPTSNLKPPQKTNFLVIANYKKPTFYKPFALISYAFMASHFSGVTTLTTYAVSIFATFGTPVDKYVATTMLGIVQMVSTLIPVIIIHSTGKRPLTFVSTLGAGVFFGAVGLYGYFYLGITELDEGKYYKEQFGETVTAMSWLPTMGLILGAFFSYVGLKLLPWLLIGEVYPAEIRGFATGLTGAVGYILGFLSNKTYFTLINLLTLSGTYILYGCIGVLSCLILYFTLPETEGWTLAEVEEHFDGKANLIKEGKKRKSHSHSPGNPAMKISDETSPL